MEPRFAESFLNRPHRVLGRQLHPYCLWHAFLLEQYASPFAMGGNAAEATLTDVAVAVAICSRGFEQPHFPRLGLVGKALLLLRRRHLSAHRQALLVYLADYVALPIVGVSSQAGGPVNTPWQLFRVAQLMHYARWSEAKAWAHPLGQAVWYAYALAEASGAKINVASEADLAAFREAGVAL